MSRFLGIPDWLLFLPSAALAGFLWLLVGQVVRDSGRPFHLLNVYFFDNLARFHSAIAEEPQPARRLRLRALQLSTYLAWAWLLVLVLMLVAG